MRLNWRTLIVLFATLSPSLSNAAGILDPSILNGLLPTDVANEAVKTLGIYFAHRPFDGAAPMFGNNALDLKLELTIMKVGPGVFTALAANGMSSGQSSSNTALPMAKLHIRKPIGPNADVGISAIYYQGQHALGFDIKFALDNPEEGVNTAFRFGYSYATASIMYLKSVNVFSPEFIISRKIESAEPYLGIGGRYITGSVAVPFTSPIAFTVTKSGSGYTAYAYTGVKFQILGSTGLRFGVEGTYDISGFSSLGTTFGIGF